MIGDLSISEFPNGLRFYVREGTNDHSTAYASAYEDEYDLSRTDVSGKLVFDVGAYIGSVGVWLASRGARVVCVEPVPDNAELIKRNAELNGVAVEVVEAAAGVHGSQIVRWAFQPDPTWNYRRPSDAIVHTHEIKTSISHHGFVGSTHRDAPVDQTYREAIVPSLSLGALATVYGIPDVIKMDCEGGEWPWLSSAFIGDVGLIVGEWHPWDTIAGSGGVGGFRGHRDGDGGWTRATIESLLRDTHSVTFSGPEAGPGGFRAEKR